MIELKEGCLLLSILRHGDADKFMSVAKEKGSGGGTIFPARGTASNSVLRFLGLGDKTRDVVLILTNQQTASEIISAAQDDCKIEGVSALIETEENKMEEKTNWKLITVIVNSGFADDIMETARKAGATGGTITHARGTVTDSRKKDFLGITIVPEKEMIMILCKDEDTSKLTDAIMNMECLQSPGIGVIFTQNVKKFINLGNTLTKEGKK